MVDPLQDGPQTSGTDKLRRMRDVEIRGEMIRLGQFLKFSGIADSGAEARALLDEQTVTVNGEPEARRASGAISLPKPWPSSSLWTTSLVAPSPAGARS